jgi:uncharacterized protein YecE (DUF72 family)
VVSHGADRGEPESGLRGYRLGCPLWALPEWQGSLYRADGRSRNWLTQYASVFNAVEGNTTFYAVPAEETVARWLEQTPEHFRFCFKFPRTISHDRRLIDADGAAREFLLRLRPLGPRLGPVMLQLPASVGPAALESLDRFLGQLPGDLRYAVELRHRRLFDDEALRTRASQVLESHGIERVVLDSRPLRSGDPRHPDVGAAEHEKPDLPVFATPLTPTPLVRLITHPDSTVTAPWLDDWAARIVRWIGQGYEPLLFVHCPNNIHSPQFARDFHARVRGHAQAAGIDVGSMPAWPGESARGGDQLSLI